MNLQKISYYGRLQKTRSFNRNNEDFSRIILLLKTFNKKFSEVSVFSLSYDW